MVSDVALLVVGTIFYAVLVVCFLYIAKYIEKIKEGEK